MGLFFFAIRCVLSFYLEPIQQCPQNTCTCWVDNGRWAWAHNRESIGSMATWKKLYNMNQLVMRKAEVIPFEMKRLCLNRTSLAVDLPILSIITPYQSNSQIEQWETWKYKVNTGNNFLSFWGFLYHL